MSFIISQIFASSRTFKVLGEIEEFEKWFKGKHPSITNSNSIFEGYKFSLECCLNSFLHGISIDQSLGIKNDFLLNCAISELIPLHQLENTCEKTIFLKHLKPLVKAILKSKDYRELKTNVKLFDEQILSKFDLLFEKNVTILKKAGVNREIAEHMLLIDFAHTYMVQINNNGPTANFHNPISPSWTKEERKILYLEGYKFAIQFLLFQLMGEEFYNKTAIQQMHLTDSWRDYKYLEKEKTGDPMIDMMNEEFELKEQTCFDSYFYHIQNEITHPLSDKYKVEPHRINDYFRFSKKNYDKKIFTNFLKEQTLKKSTEKLSWEDQIKTTLYWYTFELVDSRNSQMHHGISAFITMLAGTVAIHKPKQSEFAKVVVARFTHPVKIDKNKKGNNFTYGILVDTKSTADHYSSGWIIYQDACGDWSGFSGSQHKKCEALIKKYKREGKITLRELTIPLENFKEFTNKYILDHKQLSILDQNKRIPILIQKSRSYLFELFVYHLCSKYYRSKQYESKSYSIELNADKNSTEGEKDVVISNANEIILIECKLTPQNYNMKEMIKKLDRKLKVAKQSKKSAQFWFWNDLSIESTQILEEETKSLEFSVLAPVVVSNSKGEPILKGISLKQINEIMQNYTITNDD
ncbi:MAG: hypothetical protein IPM51_08625 [Sphingobacteriaceae bacterium]|nr:hypothetical protein [Sphingobacteriaceae bacterium]